MLAGHTVTLYGLARLRFRSRIDSSVWCFRLFGITRDPNASKVERFGLYLFSIQEKEACLHEQMF